MFGGVDEAGRGPVIGPMVIAVVVGETEALRRLGVKDSKRLRPSARMRLFDEILRVADCVNYVVVEPHIIDLYVEKDGLNALELDFTARLVEVCPADLYYVDSPDVKPERYASALALLTGQRFVALHHGEEVPQVAAASIVAKVVRDRLVELIRREVGEVGSGYPGDPKTREALQAGRVPPECVRFSWKTMRLRS